MLARQGTVLRRPGSGFAWTPCRVCPHAPRRQRIARPAEASPVDTAPTTEQAPVPIISVEPESVILTQAQHSTPARSSLPLPAIAAGVVIAAGLLLKYLQQRRVEREHAVGLRYGDPMADVLKQYNKVQVEELSPDVIEAARERRSRERANFKVNLDDVELPPNHPFATRAPISAAEEVAMKERMQVRRRTRGGPGGAAGGPGAAGGAGGAGGAPSGAAGRQGQQAAASPRRRPT